MKNLNSKTDTGLYLDVHWKLLPKTTILVLGSRRSSFDWDNNLLINPIPTIASLDSCQVISGDENYFYLTVIGTPDGSTSNSKNRFVRTDI